MSYNEGFISSIIKEKSGSGSAFDIGANVGSHTVELAEVFDKVYAFEACITTIPSLYQNCLPYKNKITIIQKAIGDKNGVVNLHYGNHNNNGQNFGGNSIAPKVWSCQKYGHKPELFFPVDMITIDSFIKEHNISDLKFIKMDIEGAEDFAWIGGIETLKNNKLDIVMETHQTVDLPNLFKFFDNLGYKFYDDKRNLVKSLIPDHHYYITNK